MAAAMGNETLEDLMNNFHKEIGQEQLTCLIQRFNGEETIENMFKSLWAVKEAHTYLTPNIVKSIKSEEASNKLRGMGNDYLVKRDLNNALEAFNQSIMVAPHPKISYSDELSCQSMGEIIEAGEGFETLSLCYARRSAVLFDLELYDLCLNDISRVKGCPKLQDELDQRKNKCQAILKTLDNVKNNQSSTATTMAPPIPKLEEPNLIMPCFSSSCKMAYMSGKGRHIIAAKDIRPGDVVLVEKAYSCSAYKDNLSTYCNTCLNECLAPLPCPSCTLVVFCSPACRREGLTTLHRRECSILPTMSTLDEASNFNNVYKILRSDSCQHWKTIVKRLDERFSRCSPEKRGINENEVFSSDDFDMFYGLMTNAPDRVCGDLYVKCLIAFVLLKLLHLTETFFTEDTGQPIQSPTEDDLIFTGQLLFSNLLKIACNGANIFDFKCTVSPTSIVKRDIGTGVYPSFSMINHSCHPTVVSYFYGYNHVLRAAKSISVGEEITLGYCRGSYLLPVEDRQIYLYNIYQFECNCEACDENWPTYSELRDELLIRCIACSEGVSEKDVKCSNCQLDYSVDDKASIEQKEALNNWRSRFSECKKANDTIQSKMKSMMAGGSFVKDDLNIIRNAMEVLEKDVPAPSPALWDARDTLELYFHLEKNINLA